MIDRDAIAKTAVTWLGTPYLHQASLKHTGSDCLGLVRGVGAELGYLPQNLAERDPRIVGYGPHPYNLMVPLLREYLDEVPIENRTKGSILIFRIRDEPQHCAIQVHGNYMIHAYQTYPYVVHCIIAEPWEKRITNVFEYRG